MARDSGVKMSQGRGGGGARDGMGKMACARAGLRWLEAAGLEVVESRQRGLRWHWRDGGVEMVGFEMAGLEAVGSRQRGPRWHG